MTFRQFITFIVFYALIVFGTAAFMPARAEAQQPPTAQVYCNALANYAEAAALDRDNGTPEYLAIDLASQHEPSDVRRDLIFAVQLAHATDAAPEKVAVVTFSLCWEVYGESA